MPLVFGLLVILNAVFLAWQFFEQQNGTRNQIVVSEEIPGKPLQLLSERADLQGKKSDGDAPVSTGKFTEADAGYCYRVGPFGDNDLVTQFKTAFVNSGFSVKVEELTADSSRYWVYIPPLTNQDKAETILRELRGRGVEGEVVTDPQFANAVSVGTFSNQDAAEALRARLLDMGFRAESRATPIVKREKWIKVSSSSSNPKNQIDRMLAGNPQLRREPAACEL